MSSPERRIAFAREALDDLDSILLHGTITWGVASARTYYDRLFDAIERIAAFPELGSVDNALSRDARSLVTGHHRVYYRIEQDAIRILRVVHERMDPSRHTAPESDQL